MQIMKPHYIIWRACGLWHLPSDKLPYKIYCKFLHITCLFFFNFLIVLGIAQADGMNDVIDILLPSTTTVTISIQALLIIRNQDKIRELFDVMRELESSTENKILERAILQRKKRDATRLFIYMSIGCYCSIIMVFAAAILTTPRKLMWTTWVPFEWEHTESMTPYWIAMIFQFSCNAYIGVLYSTVDNCGPSLYIAFTAFLEILGSRLESVGQQKSSCNNSSLYEEADESVEEELHGCIRYHSLCLRGIQCLNDVFSVHYTIQFVASGIVICVTAFQLSVVSPFKEMYQFLFLLTYIANMGSQLFIPCYFGSKLSYTSTKLTDNVFKSNWTEQSRRFKSALTIFIRCAQKPIMLYTVKRTFAIALPSFLTISRAAYSLLSCLKGF